MQCEKCHQEDFIGYRNDDHKTICEACYGVDQSYRWVKGNIMSNFEKAWEVLYEHEKGIVIDHAGYTKDGITLRSLDVDIDLDGDIDHDDIRKMTLADEKAFYKRRWWNKYKYYQILDHTISTKVFDLAVNMGARQAAKIVQRALRAYGISNVVDDGLLGLISFNAINNSFSPALLIGIRGEAAGFYRGLVAVNSDYEKYLEGWLNRAYA